jgi:hypothetical protein
VHLAAGRAAAALADLAPALRLSRSIANPYDRARTEYLAGRARVARGARPDRAAARDFLGRALATFERLGATPEADACHAALAPLNQAPRRLPPSARLGRAG